MDMNFREAHQQVAGHRAKRSEFRDPLALLPCRIRHHPTGRNALLMDIQSRTPCKHHVHATPPSTLGLAGYPEQERLPCVLDFPKEAGNSSWCRQVSRSSSVAGSGHQSEHDLATSPSERIVLCCPGMEESCVMVPLGHESSVANFHLR